MTRNLSTLERDIRAGLLAPLGILLTVVLGIASVAGILSLVFAVAMLATAFSGYSPVYALFGADEDQKTA